MEGNAEAGTEAAEGEVKPTADGAEEKAEGVEDGGEEMELPEGTVKGDDPNIRYTL